MKGVSMATLVVAIVVAIIIAVIIFFHKYKTEQERDDNRDKLFWWIAIGIAIVVGLAFLGVFSMWGPTGDEEYGIRSAIKERYRNAVDRRRAANDAAAEARREVKHKQRDQKRAEANALKNFRTAQKAPPGSLSDE